jgi:dipeptidyl aminopeptidase/acylaminoacyl peptidase
LNVNQTSITEGDTKTPSQRSPVTVDSVFTVRNALNAEISPNGEHIAFLVSEWLSDHPKQRTRLWYSPVSDDESRPLTQGTRQDISPVWAPDNQHLAFASKIEQDGVEAQFQLYVLDIVTGTEHQVCKMPNGISNVSWSPDGKFLAFTTLEGKEPEQDPFVERPEQGRHRRLWTVRADSDQPAPITPDGLSIWSYSWSPDGRHFAVYYATGPEETDWYRGQIGLVASTGGAIHQVSQLKRQAWSLAWSPDSTRISYVSGEWSDPDRGGGDLYVHSLTDGGTHNLTPQLDWSPTWNRWFPDGQRILCAGWDGLSTRISVLDVDTGIITTLSDNFTIGDRGWPHLSTTADMKYVVTTHSEQHPYDVWLGKLTINATNSDNKQAESISWHRRTRLNPIAEETLALNPTERIRYESVDGWLIDAMITWPSKRSDGTPPPLIVHVHGGPSGIWLDDWEFYRSQVLATAGYAVLRPNIRGSMGRGVAFADAVIGDMGGKDFQDVLKGVDYLIERQLVDSDRVGIMGWSYGGFMSAWAVTQTGRFKAAVMGAGISDFHSFHAQTNIQDWDMRFLGQVNEPVSPLTHSDLYRRYSPITYACNVTTPTLIVHGQKDLCVPLNQAYAFYRALQEQHVPVELVTYPREGHGPSEHHHVRDYMQSVLRWFERYLAK